MDTELGKCSDITPCHHLINVCNSDDSRPKRSTRGQGGVIAQLAAVSDQIRPDLRPGRQTRSMTQGIPSDVPENDMAPPVRKRRGVSYLLSNLIAVLMLCIKVKSSLHVDDERPLVVTIPKPSLVPAKPGSTFGFRLNSVTSGSTTGVATSNRKATNASAELSEIIPEDDSNQDVDMDLDPGNDVDEGSFGAYNFSIFPPAVLTYTTEPPFQMIPAG